jgi:hypothetical protein
MRFVTVTGMCDLFYPTKSTSRSSAINAPKVKFCQRNCIGIKALVQLAKRKTFKKQKGKKFFISPRYKTRFQPMVTGIMIMLWPSFAEESHSCLDQPYMRETR